MAFGAPAQQVQRGKRGRRPRQKGGGMRVLGHRKPSRAHPGRAGLLLVGFAFTIPPRFEQLRWATVPACRWLSGSLAETVCRVRQQNARKVQCREGCRAAALSQTPLSRSTRRIEDDLAALPAPTHARTLPPLREHRLAGRLRHAAAHRQPPSAVARAVHEAGPQQGGQRESESWWRPLGDGSFDTLVLPRAASPTSISTAAEKDTYSTSASENDRFTRETAGMDRPHPRRARRITLRTRKCC